MLRLSCVFLVLASSGASFAADSPPTTAAEFLTRDRVWPVHLQLTDKEWQAMQATKKGGFAWLFGPKLPARPAVEADRPKSVSPFGYEYPYARAKVEIAGLSLESAGLRYKGNSSFATARGNKRPFKIDFDRFTEQSFVGLSELNLSNNVMDPSCLREAMAYDFFRAAGVPAPRTTYAQVYLSVGGQSPREYLGLYTVVECVDKRFLKEHFGSSKGLLAKPEKTGGLSYLGDDWAKYPPMYGVKGEPSEADGRRLIEFTKLIFKADDTEFRAKIADYLDMDAFLRLMAANCLIANLDSFFGLGHNFYLYLNPKSHKFVIIPWDLDHSFGSLGMAASHEEMMKWSIGRPYLGNNKLAERVLAMPEHLARYQDNVRTLLAGPFQMTERIEATKTAIAAALAEEPKSAGNSKGPPRPWKPTDLSAFVTKRTASVEEQLAGKSLGHEARWNLFGKPGALGWALSERMLLAADSDKDGKLSLPELEKASVDWFHAVGADEVRDDAINEALEPLLPPPGKVPLPVKGLIAGLFKRAKADDQPLKLDAVKPLAQKLFAEWDRNKDQKLDRDELTRGINGMVAK